MGLVTGGVSYKGMHSYWLNKGGGRVGLAETSCHKVRKILDVIRYIMSSRGGRSHQPPGEQPNTNLTKNAFLLLVVTACLSYSHRNHNSKHPNRATGTYAGNYVHRLIQAIFTYFHIPSYALFAVNSANGF